MKSNPPIKRHPSMVSFSKDHHFGLLLVWKIREGFKKSVEANRISNYVEYFFEEDLSQHFNDEEKLLFSQLPADDEMRKRAEGEHVAIYSLVKKITINKDDSVLLNQLADELEKHIRFEERELFNHIQEILEPALHEEIAKRLSANSKAIDEKWDDHFWMDKKKKN